MNGSFVRLVGTFVPSVVVGAALLFGELHLAFLCAHARATCSLIRSTPLYARYEWDTEGLAPVVADGPMSMDLFRHDDESVRGVA